MSLKEALKDKANEGNGSNTTVIAKPEKREEPKTMQDWLMNAYEDGKIKNALANNITPERFLQMAFTALEENPKLGQCTPKSLMNSFIKCAQLGLEPNTPLGHAYIIPRNNKNVLEAQFQIGYRGNVQLVYRSGQVKRVYAECVYEKDQFSYKMGLNPNLDHIPTIEEDRGKLIYIYAGYEMVNGGFDFTVMSAKQVWAHAKKYSQGVDSNYSPWKKDFEEMAKKTVLKKALKYAPLSIETQKQLATEYSEMPYIPEVDYSVMEVQETPQEPPANTEINDAVMDGIIDGIKQ
jgi:recombination protein RecT